MSAKVTRRSTRTSRRGKPRKKGSHVADSEDAEELKDAPESGSAPLPPNLDKSPLSPEKSARKGRRDGEADGNASDVSNASRGSASSLTRRHRRSSGIKDRMWEKEQLQEINFRVDNIFQHFANMHSGDNGDLVARLKELQDAYDRKLQHITADFARKSDVKAQQLTDANARIRELERERSDLQEELTIERTKLRRKMGENAGLKNELEDALRAKESIESQLQNKLDILETSTEALREENAKLRQQNEDLLKQIEQHEDELERQFLDRLTKTIEDRERHFANVKAQMDETFQQQLQDVKDRLGKQIEDLEKQLDGQRKELVDLQRDNDKLLKERDDARAKYQEERDARERAQRMNREQRQSLQDIAKDKQRQFNELEEAFNRLSHEFFCINEINVELENEIAALKKKLDMIEEQHQIESPVRPKKRQRMSPGLNRPVELKAVRSQTVSRHGFPLSVVTCQYKGDWKGFELINEWERPIRMVGWRLTDGSGEKSLPLPDREINSKEMLRVCLGGHKKEPTDLVWKNVSIDPSKKQELFVRDNFGNEHMLIDLEAVKASGDSSNCFVM